MAETPAAEENPQMKQLLQREMRRELFSHLNALNVPADRHQSIWRYILTESDTSLEDLEDRNTVVQVTREWAQADGIDLKALIGAKPQEEEKPKAPPTGNKRSATTPRAVSEDGEEESKPKAAATKDEWRSNRERMLRSMTESFVAQE